MKRRSSTNSERDIANAPQTISPPAVASSRAVVPEQDLSREEIASLAYSYWMNRPASEGSAEDDWLRAEQELRTKRGQVKTAGSAGGAA